MNLASLLSVLFLAGWLLLLTLSGCATLPITQPGTPAEQVAGQALLEDWLTRRAQYRTVQGMAKVRVQTAEKTVNGVQVILAETPDRLRAETLSPFGAPLLMLAADGMELSVLLPGDDLFYTGQATPENLGRFTRLPLRLSDLVGILLARPPLIAYRQLAFWRLSDGGWRLELEAEPRRQELVFDASRRLVEVRYLSRGEEQLQLNYSRFDQEQSEFPRKVELVLPLQGTRASLDFSELAVGQASPSGIFALQPPAGTTVVRLDELSVPADGSGTAGSAEKPALPTGEGDK
jgi:outer membrane lipoprotein-sorting protein